MENHEEAIIDGRPQTVMAVLDQFATSAEGIEKFAHLVITEVKEGREDPLKVALLMKTMEKIGEIVNNELRGSYVSEAEKYGTKPFKLHGAEISIGEVGGRWNFSNCGHPDWEFYDQQIHSSAQSQKKVEELLKAIHGPTDLIVDGEGVTVKPPVKVGAKTGIKISIK